MDKIKLFKVNEYSMVEFLKSETKFLFIDSLSYQFLYFKFGDSFQTIEYPSGVYILPNE